MAYMREDGSMTQEGAKKVARIVGWTIVIFIALVLFFASFGTIAQSEVGIKTRLGKVVGIVEPGPYLKIPFLEGVHPIGTNTRTINYDKNGHEGDQADTSQLTGVSKDLQKIEMGVTVNYRVDGTKADKIYVQYRTVSIFEANAIENIVRDTVKAVAGQYTVEELTTNRDGFTEAIRLALIDKFTAADAIVERVNVTNIEPSKAFMDAVEAKVVQTQKTEEAKNKLQQVQFEAQQKVETAKADAETIRIQAQAINAQGGADYVALQWIKAWQAGGAQVPQIINGGNSSNFLLDVSSLRK